MIGHGFSCISLILSSRAQKRKNFLISLLKPSIIKIVKLNKYITWNIETKVNFPYGQKNRINKYKVLKIIVSFLTFFPFPFQTLLIWLRPAHSTKAMSKTPLTMFLNLVTPFWLHPPGLWVPPLRCCLLSPLCHPFTTSPHSFSPRCLPDMSSLMSRRCHKPKWQNRTLDSQLTDVVWL